MVSQGEVESPLQKTEIQRRIQSSIYNLTLDGSQSSLGGGSVAGGSRGGKNFGSMNMDELLASIWNVDENQSGKPVPLARQGSFALKEPLCRKTVDEVWSEIQETQESSTADQEDRVIYGEMTLEEFLVKAGVIKGHQAPHPPQPSYVSFQNSNDPRRSVVVPSYHHAAPPRLLGTMRSGYSHHTSAVYGYGGPVQASRAASPVSSDGQNGSNFRARGSRNRFIDGPVERKRRRMIKNRESAARSRARKQAYTEELEAELNQVKQENTRLKEALEELERSRNNEVKEEIRRSMNYPSS